MKATACIYGDLTPLTHETGNLSREVKHERYESGKYVTDRKTSSSRRRGEHGSSEEYRDCHTTVGRVYASDMQLGGQPSRVGTPESAGANEEFPVSGERDLETKEVSDRFRLQNLHFSRSRKFVPDTRDRGDQLRSAGFFFELLPKAEYVDVDRSRVGTGIIAPDCAQQFCPGNRLPCALHEVA